jgi:hypothetical protein
MPDADLEAILSNRLKHLHGHLAAETLVTLEAKLDADGRTGLLSHFKLLGISFLKDRQDLVNAVSKAKRERAAGGVMPDRALADPRVVEAPSEGHLYDCDVFGTLRGLVCRPAQEHADLGPNPYEEADSGQVLPRQVAVDGHPGFGHLAGRDGGVPTGSAATLAMSAAHLELFAAGSDPLAAAVAAIEGPAAQGATAADPLDLGHMASAASPAAPPADPAARAATATLGAPAAASTDAQVDAQDGAQDDAHDDGLGPLRNKGLDPKLFQALAAAGDRRALSSALIEAGFKTGTRLKLEAALQPWRTPRAPPSSSASQVSPHASSRATPAPSVPSEPPKPPMPPEQPGQPEPLEFPIAVPADYSPEDRTRMACLACKCSPQRGDYSPEDRTRRRREAAEAGRRLAQQAREDEEKAMRAAAAQHEAAERRKSAQLIEQRRQRAELLAAQVEARAKAAPPPSSLLAAEELVRPRVPTTTPMADAASAAGAASGTTGHSRQQRVDALKTARKAQRAERAILLAEAKADREYRAARSARRPSSVAAEPPATEAASAAPSLLGVPSAHEVAAPATLEPLRVLERSTSLAERASRLHVRMPSGESIEVPFDRDRPVEELLELVGIELLRIHSVEALVEQYTLLDRSRFPPAELDDAEGTFGEAGLCGGAMLVLQRRDATLQQGKPRKPRVPKRAPPKPQHAPTTSLAVAGGRIVGTLCGSYTFADEAFRRAGMLLLVGEPTAAGDAALAALQPQLHNLSFAFRLPSTDAHGRPASLVSWTDDVYEVLQGLVREHALLLIRAIVGHGVAADACLAYAQQYGHAASCPTRQLVLLSGSHAEGRASRWPAVDWRLLSIVGAADGTSLTNVELFHVRHRPCTPGASKVRLLEGADRSYAGAAAATAAATINDWLEGARRLDDSDMNYWSIYGSVTPPASLDRLLLAAAAIDDTPLVGTMARAAEIQLECLADDLQLSDAMCSWSEKRLRDYFEAGGA